MHRLTARTCWFPFFLALNVSCGSDAPEEQQVAGSSSSGGGATAGLGGVGGAQASSGAPGTAGSAAGATNGTGGVSGAGGEAGGGMPALTPEELLAASHSECSKGCTLVLSACPNSNFVNCVGGCTSQADSYFDSGKCGLEFYEAWVCINRDLGPTDVTCAMSSGHSATFNGCGPEQARYTQCL